MKRLPLLLALGGPALLGLWLAIRVESCGFAQGTIGLPLAVLATALISVPALYIGAAVFKAAPSPGVVVAGIARSLDDAGLVLLGLMPAVLFLGATARSSKIALLLGLLALGGSAVFGLRLAFSRLFTTAEARVRVLPVFGAWAVVTLGIGLTMVKSFVEGLQ
ncbi:MAG: hypothetical protein R3F60_15750 [bacterium]